MQTIPEPIRNIRMPSSAFGMMTAREEALPYLAKTAPEKFRLQLSLEQVPMKRLIKTKTGWILRRHLLFRQGEFSFAHAMHDTGFSGLRFLCRCISGIAVMHTVRFGKLFACRVSAPDAFRGIMAFLLSLKIFLRAY